MIHSTASSMFLAATARHPIGGWVMAAVFASIFVGLLAVAIVVTTWLDRTHHADMSKARNDGPTLAERRTQHLRRP